MPVASVHANTIKLVIEAPVGQLRTYAGKLDALTSLRFFAAAMIVVWHLNGSLNLPMFLGTTTLSAGVSFFFVLSGFILTYVYPAAEQLNVRRFIVARVARIWPLQVVTVLIMFPYTYQVWMHRWPVREQIGIMFTELTLTQAWLNNAKYNSIFDPPSWSLCAELFFYLMFPLLLWKWQTTWRWKLLLTLLVVPCVAMLRDLPGHRALNVASLLYTFPAIHLFEFTLGIATAHLWRVLRPRATFSRWVGTLLELLALLLAGSIVVKGFDWSIALTNHSHLSPDSYAWLAPAGFVCVPFALLIAVIALNRGWISHLLTAAPLVLLGEISFSIYMLHTIAIRFFDLHPDFYLAYSEPILLAAFVCVILLAAYCSWVFIEIPARRAILVWYDRWAARKAGTTKPALRETIPRPRAIRAMLHSRYSAGCIAGLLLVITIGSLLHLSAAPSLAGRTRTDTGMIYHVDVANALLPQDGPVIVRQNSERNAMIPMNGWVVDDKNHRLARAVYIAIDNRAAYLASYGELREDVGAYYDNTGYNHSGFSVQIPLRDLTPGEHTVTLKVVRSDHQTYFESKKFGLVVQP